MYLRLLGSSFFLFRFHSLCQVRSFIIRRFLNISSLSQCSFHCSLFLLSGELFTLLFLFLLGILICFCLSLLLLLLVFGTSLGLLSSSSLFCLLDFFCLGLSSNSDLTQESLELGILLCFLLLLRQLFNWLDFYTFKMKIKYER